MRGFFHRIKSKLEGYDFFDTLKHTSTYFSATILINLLGLVSLRVYTNFLSEGEFGVVEVFNQTVKILAVLMTLNMHQAVGRYYFEGAKDWRDFLGSTFLSTSFVFILVSGLLIFFKEELINLWNIPGDLFYWLFPATVSLIILSVFNNLFIARKESVLVSKGQVLFSYSRFFGALVLLLLISPAYYARVAGDVLMSIVLGTYLFYKIYPHIKWVFSKEHLKYILKFSLPLVPFSISAFLLSYFDLFMINSESNEEAGLYAFAYKIGILFLGLDQALQNAGKPDFFKWMNDKNYQPITGQVKSIMKFEVIGSVFLILFAGDIGRLLSSKESFTVALHLVPIIVLGYVFYGVYNFYARLIIYSKKTIYISAITILAGILNIVLNSMFIPEYGYEAAAYTTLVSYMSMLLMGWIIVAFFMKLPMPPLGNILLKIGFITLIFFLGFYIENGNFDYLLSIVLRVVIFSFVFFILFWDKLLGLVKRTN